MFSGIVYAFRGGGKVLCCSDAAESFLFI